MAHSHIAAKCEVCVRDIMAHEFSKTFTPNLWLGRMKSRTLFASFSLTYLDSESVCA